MTKNKKKCKRLNSEALMIDSAAPALWSVSEGYRTNTFRFFKAFFHLKERGNILYQGFLLLLIVTSMSVPWKFPHR